MKNIIIASAISFLAATASAESATEYATCESGLKAVYECAADPDATNEATQALSMVSAITVCEPSEYEGTLEERTLFVKNKQGYNYKLSNTVVARNVGATVYTANINRSYSLKVVFGTRRPHDKALRKVTAIFEKFNGATVDVAFYCKVN